MCLTIDKNLTEKGLKGRKVHSNGMVKVWKVIGIDCGVPVSIYKNNFQWKPGWNKSNRITPTLNENELVNNEVNFGIHVLLTREDAGFYMRRCEIVIPVYVYKKDLIACGMSNWTASGRDCKEAVFTKVFLKKEDFKIKRILNMEK